MSTRMAPIVLFASILAASMAAALAQGAQSDDGEKAFVDPTRPPDMADVAPGNAAPGKPMSPTLQSVLIAPGRRLAVINGEMVRQGGTYGEAKVVRVSATSVLLRFPDHEQTLELLPGIEKSQWPHMKKKNSRIRRVQP
jgi:MSHA biogenesis protein MshK